MLKRLSLLIPALRVLHEERNRYAQDISQLTSVITYLQAEKLSLESNIQNNSVIVGKLQDSVFTLATTNTELNAELNYLKRRHQNAVYASLSADLPLARQGNRKIKVLIVAYFAETWTGYDQLVKTMLNDDDFEVLVVSTMHTFNEYEFGGEDKIHNMLSNSGIPHLRWNEETCQNNTSRARVTEFYPDYVFRQTPWEDSVPDEFKLDRFTTSRLCYIPYGLYVADTSDVLTKLPYIKACWRIFCINLCNFDYFRTNSEVPPTNIVVTGHPKLDYITSYDPKPGDWPINLNGNSDRFRVLWAPHHSVTKNWLGFAAFSKTYLHLLEWAKRDNKVEIVLRPHHLTFENLIKYDVLTKKELDDFLNTVDALPNMVLDPNIDCAPCFSACDVLITDGVSFLAEYQVLNKPLIFIESDLERAPFTKFGSDFYDAAYKFTMADEAIKFMADYHVTRADPNKSKRIHAINKHIVDRNSVYRIVHELKRGCGYC